MIIKYELSTGCIELLESIESNVVDYYDQKLRELDVLLATRKIKEQEYLEKKEKLEGYKKRK